MSRPDELDPPTLELVRFAAAIAAGEETDLRARVATLCHGEVPVEWVEELLLQSVLMVGYPRALVALAIWRQHGGATAPPWDPDAEYSRVATWQVRGEETCATVYGANYWKLRANIRSLHPALDAWMITEGYGRTLARLGLELWRRELCVVAQVAMLGAWRQLHSHLRGALNSGARCEQIDAVLAVIDPLLGRHQWGRVEELWQSVREAWRGRG